MASTAAGDRTPPENALLAVREAVARNEDLTSLIKMDFHVQLGTVGGEPATSGEQALSAAGNLKTGPKSYTRFDATWAQDGVKQYFVMTGYQGDEALRSSVRVIDGEVQKSATLPDMMSGSVAPMGQWNWTPVSPTKLGFRPFEGQSMLSQVLAEPYASVHDGREVVNDREVVVVDVESPTDPVYHARIWIDSERGVPLRFRYYDKKPEAQDAILLWEIDSVQVHQLANGAWLPVSGHRYVHLQGDINQTRTEYIQVNADSITTRKEDIPDSLFTIAFPVGARVGNAVLGTVGVVQDPSLEPGLEAVYQAMDSLQATTPSTQPAGMLASEDQTHPQGENATASREHRPTRTEQGARRLRVGPVWLLVVAFVGTFSATLLVLSLRKGAVGRRMGSESNAAS